MIPVSGAKQSKYSGPIGKHPMISHTGAFEVGERVGIVALEHVAQPGHLRLGLELVHSSGPSSRRLGACRGLVRIDVLLHELGHAAAGFLRTLTGAGTLGFPYGLTGLSRP